MRFCYYSNNETHPFCSDFRAWLLQLAIGFNLVNRAVQYSSTCASACVLHTLRDTLKEA
jgi:hypothetical protein